MLNNKKGITLIALVVTVVVLIILAGVSINAVLGDNGIIKKANQAASVTKEAEVKEAINRTILEFYLTNDYETLEDFLKAKAEDGSIDSVTKNADGTLTVKKGEYSVTVENKTNSSGGSSSGGSTGGETQTPEITIGEAKVVANSDGTGSAITDAASVYLGNTLYITFSHSITGGTTVVDKTIPYAVTKNGTYTFTDKNNVLSDFDAAVTNGDIVSKSGDTLKIKADNGKIAEITLTQNNVKESGERTGFFTLTSDSKQTLAELKADPRKYYAAVKGVENGTLEIIKTSEDGIVADRKRKDV